MQTIEDLKQYTFKALLENSVKKFEKEKALSLVNGKPITYRELYEKSLVISNLLKNSGLKKGDKVAIYSSSMPQWGIVYFGIVNAGFIAVPLLPDFSASEIETILEHSETKVVFVAEKMKARLDTIKEDLIEILFKIEDFSLFYGNIDKKQLSLNPLSPEERKMLEEIKIREEDIASIIYTSGTTGRSKGVVLTHKNIVYNAVQCQTVHRVHKRDRALSFLPLSHVYEFTIGFVMQMLNGSAVYYLGKPPTVTSLLPAFKKIRPTLVLSVPMIIEKIYKNKVLPELTKTDLTKKLYQKPFFRKILHRIAGKSLNKTFGGKINFFGFGGAKVDPEVELFMKEARFKYAIGYGLTETAPLIAGSGTKNTIPGTIGPVLEGVELAILNPDPETGVGEIVAKGENIMQGYYKDEALTKSVFTTEEDSTGSGWFKTGDLGIIDKKNRLSIKGRLKNMILNSAGENIYPEDIEFILNQHPLVTESLVVEDGNGLVALVQLDNEKLEKEKGEGFTKIAGNTINEIKNDLLYLQEEVLSEIHFFVNQKVNRISKLSAVRYIQEFEKTASQKIKRYLYGKSKSDEENTQSELNKKNSEE
jgi:long-chain acyl-CoA synthetase